MTRRAFITGITGQDGSYLAEFLLEKGYEVHGLVRRASSFNTGRIDHLYQDPHEENPRLRLHYGDLTDSASISRLILELEPDEVYNLGAKSRASFVRPAAIHRRRSGRGHAAHAGSRTAIGAAEGRALLSGGFERNVRQSSRNPAARNDAIAAT